MATKLNRVASNRGHFKINADFSALASECSSTGALISKTSSVIAMAIRPSQKASSL